MESRPEKPGPSKRVHSDEDNSTGINPEETNPGSPISALYRVFTVLVHCLDPDPVLDNLLQLGFPPVIIRDIRDEKLTSDRNRKLIEEVRKRGCEAYLKFKNSLQQSGQGMICTLLERTEKGENTSDIQRVLREKAQEKMKHEQEDDKLYTGAAPDSRCKYTLVTEAVIGVIGKESVSVAGSAGQEMDTTLIQLRQSTSQSATMDKDTNSQEARGILQMSGKSAVTSVNNVPSSQISQSTGSSSSNYCQCDPELAMLQKRKLRLEIEYFELKIKKLKGEICIQNEC